MTTSGFAAYAALGVAREELATSPEAREVMVALNNGVIALDRIGRELGAFAGADGGREGADELRERLVAVIDSLEEAAGEIRSSGQT
ncbi:hypothetical protein [Marinitenerispora sediminis]|uniref:hypothetical protein n=1 Tax=Marinitenerispora sediminis TaxID=1931232 RepID=UPI0011C05E1D|nr:hypothetical protein [Marinitenerispora sediminis]